jgi:hypothetical protein
MARETWTVKFDGKVETSLTDVQLAQAVKIVGHLRRPRPGSPIATRTAFPSTSFFSFAIPRLSPSDRH